jgi:hypothetical protein
MDEPATGSDWNSEVEDSVVLAYHDLHSRHPFYWALSDPPGILITRAQITNLTITISATGASGVAGTLSAAPAGSVSILDYHIRPAGVLWAARVTAHTADGTAVTLQGVPATIAAGTATTIYQIENDLASDFGYFDSHLRDQDGALIEIWDYERLIAEYPDPPSPGWPPRAAAIMTNRKIRWSTYPTAARRLEYPYIVTEADISGTGDIRVPQHLRWVVAHGALFFALTMKSDKRAGLFKQEYERGIQVAVAFDRRVRMGVGRVPQSVSYGAYGS